LIIFIGIMSSTSVTDGVLKSKRHAAVVDQCQLFLDYFGGGLPVVGCDDGRPTSRS
jgi:hypothetical protein